MSWANAQLDQSKIPETKLRLIKYNWELTFVSALKFFKEDSYLLILREIQTNQNLRFIFHDRHIFLALLLM